MPADEVHRRVTEVLGFVGLGEYIERMPSELSGGQRRRVAIARAMASKPQLLLFDDPTSGLDPITAKTVMAEIIKLRDLENVTPIVVTHQLPDAFYVATHHAVNANGQVTVAHTDGEEPQADIILLANGGVHFAGTAAQFRASRDPQVLAFLTGWVPPLV
jgi:phospholipid/cholesterol/gamma-HCH transport system ATP-binding protein